MSEDSVKLTVEQAISCLNDGDTIHTFLNPNGALVGADYSRDKVIKILKKNPDKIEIGGPTSRKFKHALIVWEEDRPLFIEANEEKINEFDPINSKDNEQQKDNG